MYRIVRESKVLDVNSQYSYLLWSTYFHQSSIVAYDEDKAIGFITGFIPPEREDTLFVWQIAVDEAYRGYGLATQLIEQLLARLNEHKQLKFVEATVTPSNKASRNLFKGIAEKYDTNCVIRDCFLEEDFAGSGHESEQIFRIGPILKK